MLKRATSADTRAHAAAPVLWITGLAGCGKTTLAQALHAVVQQDDDRVVFLDGDVFRASHMGRLASRYDRSARLAMAWRLARHAHALQRQGSPVIVATQSLFGAVHRWNRGVMPSYAEVLLSVPVRILRERRSELYQRGKRQVVGRDQRAEFPQAAELVLRTDGATPDLHAQLEAVLALWRTLQVNP